MFAALTIPRLIEAVRAVPELSFKPSWRSNDDVEPQDLPLAKAVQKVLASMQAILASTAEACHTAMEVYDARAKREGREGEENDEEIMKKRHLALTNASEVKVVRYVKELIDPPHLDRFTPRAVLEGDKVPDDVGEKKADELNVVHLGTGPEGEGAIQVVVGQDLDGVQDGIGLGKGRELRESGLAAVQPGTLDLKSTEEES